MNHIAAKVYTTINDKEVYCGCLHIEKSRKGVVFSFSYDKSYLSIDGFFNIDPNLELHTHKQYPHGEKTTFGFLEDISPDRWGRALIRRKLNVKYISEFDAIVNVSDRLRMGATRIFINDIPVEDSVNIPKLLDINRLIDASKDIENASKDIQELYEPGSPLGGARPKAAILDTKTGIYYMAKFPKEDDSIDIEAWEKTYLELAKTVGLNVSNSVTLSTKASKNTVLLVQRFDRNPSGNRVPYISAMTALGESDGSDSGSYIEIADFIGKHGNILDCQELWKRMVFSSLVCNFDDHLRNHGFLWAGSEWRLSPAFDINPSLDKSEHALSIDGYTNEPNILNFIDLADFFYMKESEAKSWSFYAINEISSKIKVIANKYVSKKSEIDDVVNHVLDYGLFFQKEILDLKFSKNSKLEDRLLYYREKSENLYSKGVISKEHEVYTKLWNFAQELIDRQSKNLKMLKLSKDCEQS